jgi:hypothetical protein
MPLSTTLNDSRDYRAKLLHRSLTEHGLREPTEETDLVRASLDSGDITPVARGRGEFPIIGL